MKKLFLALTPALMLVSCAVLAQNTTTMTRFEDQRITGVDASSAFDVVLVKSDRTRAVVEIQRDLEPYVKISRDAAGVVSISLRDVDNRRWRDFNRLPEKERIIRLTLHLPTISTIRLSGAADLSSSDSFNCENVDIQLTGASDIKGSLAIASTNVKLQCSGASDASLNLPATRNLVVVASGASDIEISATGLTYSRISVSGASDLEIRGDGQRGEWTASGASEIKGDRFAAKKLSVTASGASSARVNVSGTLTARASGASSIRYAGKPAKINNTSDDVRPL